MFNNQELNKHTPWLAIYLIIYKDLKLKETVRQLIQVIRNNQVLYLNFKIKINSTRVLFRLPLLNKQLEMVEGHSPEQLRMLNQDQAWFLLKIIELFTIQIKPKLIKGNNLIRFKKHKPMEALQLIQLMLKDLMVVLSLKIKVI